MVASPATAVFTVEEPGLGLGLCNVKLPGSTWLSPSVHIPSVPSSSALATVTSSVPSTPPQLTRPHASTVFAKNFRVAAAMKTSVLLSWEVPDSYKSAVPFKVGRLLPPGPELPPTSALHCHSDPSAHRRMSRELDPPAAFAPCRLVGGSPPRGIRCSSASPYRSCTMGRAWRWTGTRCGS